MKKLTAFTSLILLAFTYNEAFSQQTGTSQWYVGMGTQLYFKTNPDKIDNKGTNALYIATQFKPSWLVGTRYTIGSRKYNLNVPDLGIENNEKFGFAGAFVRKEFKIYKPLSFFTEAELGYHYLNGNGSETNIAGIKNTYIYKYQAAYLGLTPGLNVKLCNAISLEASLPFAGIMSYGKNSRIGTNYNNTSTGWNFGSGINNGAAGNINIGLRIQFGIKKK